MTHGLLTVTVFFESQQFPFSSFSVLFLIFFDTVRIVKRYPILDYRAYGSGANP